MAETLRLEIVTPQATVFSDDVHMVTLPVLEGQIGVYPQHLHLITQVVPGELIVHKDGNDTFLAVGEGLVEITAHRVSIVTDMAIPADGIDEAKAEEARERARARLQDKISDEEVASVNASLARSLAQLQVPTPASDAFMKAAPAAPPVFGWLREYRAEWVRPDVVAGLTLAAYLLPAGIGDASLAGLSPEAGLYACLFSGLVFWIFCSSTRTVITVTSALSLLIGASVGELSAGDPARHAALAACVALLLAAIAIAAWLVRAGNAIGFFSETVLVGFKAGLALYLASTQLPKLFGFKGTHGDFWERSGYFLQHLGDTHATSLLVGVAALAVLVAGKLWLKNRPVAFFVVVAGIVAAAVLDLDSRGVSLLGIVPEGLPALGLPAVSRADVNALLPMALACFVLGAVETSAIGRMFAQKHGQRLDANQEILALGVSNLVAGLGRGFPVSGGMSQSLVNESAGARTPLSGLVAAVVTLCVVLFASGLLRNLPQPVLAAIVLAAVMSLVDLHALRQIWRFSRTEFFVAIAALMGVLGSGPVNGVLLGAAISIVLLLRQASRPRVSELARIGETTYFADRLRNPENQATPGVLVVRCEASLLYFNVTFVSDRVFQFLGARQDAIKLVVLYLGAVPRIDLAGAEFIAELDRVLRSRGIALRLADAHGDVRDALRRIGFEREQGPLESGQSVDVVVSQWLAEQAGRA